MIVHGDTYQDREELVGVMPDVLTCVGGGDGTMREAQAAARHGSVILILSLRNYSNALADRYRSDRFLRAAETSGRLFVCRSMAAIPECASAALRAERQVRATSRPSRIRTVRHMLAY
jgi:hypothetical protein